MVVHNDAHSVHIQPQSLRQLRPVCLGHQSRSCLVQHQRGFEYPISLMQVRQSTHLVLLSQSCIFRLHRQYREGAQHHGFYPFQGRSAVTQCLGSIQRVHGIPAVCFTPDSFQHPIICQSFSPPGSSWSGAGTGMGLVPRAMAVVELISRIHRGQIGPIVLPYLHTHL